MIIPIQIKEIYRDSEGRIFMYTDLSNLDIEFKLSNNKIIFRSIYPTENYKNFILDYKDIAEKYYKEKNKEKKNINIYNPLYKFSFNRENGILKLYVERRNNAAI